MARFDGRSHGTEAGTEPGCGRRHHVGLRVASRDDLVAWQEHLEAQGVVRADTADKPLTQSPITDAPYGSVLVFRDPDNIQLEFIYAP